MRIVGSCRQPWWRRLRVRLCKEIVRKKLRNLGGRILSPISPQWKMAIPQIWKIRNWKFKKQNEIFPQNKIGVCSWKGIDIGQLKITGKPVKYIVPGIYDRNMKRESLPRSFRKRGEVCFVFFTKNFRRFSSNSVGECRLSYLIKRWDGGLVDERMDLYYNACERCLNLVWLLLQWKKT